MDCHTVHCVRFLSDNLQGILYHDCFLFLLNERQKSFRNQDSIMYSKMTLLLLLFFFTFFLLSHYMLFLVHTKIVIMVMHVISVICIPLCIPGGLTVMSSYCEITSLGIILSCLVRIFFFL